MKYCEVKDKLLSLFSRDKLDANPDEWGFFNETGREIRRVGYATNITPEIIEQAAADGVDLFLTHHDSWDFVFGLRDECNRLLTAHHITHGFFHAVLDDAAFGTNASLAALLHLPNTQQVMPYGENLYSGVIGELQQPVPFDEFALQLSTLLHEPLRQYKNNHKPVRKVCIATGGGNMTTEMKHAVDAGCDTYITGEYVLYSQQYAQLKQMNLLVGSHTQTEVFGVQSIAELLVADTGLELVRVAEPNF